MGREAMDACMMCLQGPELQDDMHGLQRASGRGMQAGIR